MGTHTSLSSKVNITSEVLSSFLQAHPHFIGDKVIQRFKSTSTGNLPFLFKILAIRKALSIQAHPNKELAEKLYRERPDMYKGQKQVFPLLLPRDCWLTLNCLDGNHKPEMAIALTDFRALCGFRPLQEIEIYLTHVRELSSLIPPQILARFTTIANSSNPQGPMEKSVLKEVWSALMTAEPSVYQTELKKLVQSYKAGSVSVEEESVKDLVLTIE
jgi:mannose-6-phosphate isomerase